MLKLDRLSFSLKKGSILSLRRVNRGFGFDWLAAPGKGIRHDLEE